MALVRTKLLTLAAVVLAGYPGAARAQLFFSPNPAALTISAPGSAAGPVTVSASSPTPISAVSVAGVTTSDGTNWLCAIVNSFNSVNVFVGMGGCSNITTTQLAANANYTGKVTVQGNGGGLIGSFDVTLQVGTGSGGAGLVANPNSVSFTENIPGQPTPASQTISATFNGAPIAITGANFTPNSGVPVFINTPSFNNGTVILTVNSNVTTAGVYQGTENLITSSGNLNVPVTLSFGGTGGTNLIASPNPVNFNVQTGGTAAPQNVTITVNGAPVTINSVAASGGASWLLPSFQSNVAGNVNVGVNASGLSIGIYNGIVTVVTPQGQVSFQVNLTVAGTPTLNANPAALNFAYQVGTSNPLSQTISVTSNGSPVNLSVNPTTSSGGGQWLIVTPTGQAGTPITLTVSVNPAGLAPGFTYQGNVQINTFGASTNPVVNIPISLLVSNSPVLVANPASLSFTAPVGGGAAAQNLQLSSSSTALNYTVTSSVTSPAGSTWLQVPTQVGTTPGVVNVPVNLQTVPAAPGTYTGSITVTAPSAGNTPVTVPVSLTITPGATLQLSPASLSFADQIGQAQPPSQGVTVSSNSGPTNYTISTQTNSGQPWLNVSTSSGTTPGNFVVGVNSAGLTSGTYDGSVTVTSTGSPQTIPVRLVVSNTALLVVSPGSLTFSAAQGSLNSSFQNVAVTSTDGSPISFNIAAGTSTGANWLLASTSTGTTASNLTFSANPNGLAIGSYSGTITITATTPNVANSPQTIAVTLNITPTATLTASSTSLSFAQTINGSAPASQTLTVSSVGAPITFNANVTLFQGLNWLTVSPTSATASPSSPATLTVTANGSGLLPGIYNGQIALSSPGASNAVVVNVTLTVSNTPTITINPASLAPVFFQIGGANPAPQTIAVSLAGGGAVAFNASATVSSGTNWLSVSPTAGTTPANVTVSVNPSGLTAGSYQGTVTITVAGATNSPVTLVIGLTVGPAPVTGPTVAAIQNAASSAPTSLAPGLNILIYGANMGPATLTPYQVGPNGALLTTLVGTQVAFDGILAPIIFTRDTLVSVMVPYEIAGRISSAMVVSYNGVPSAPLQLRVVDTAPGIYSLNSSGSGQGAILNENFSVNSPANPEAAGHYIQIYGTGEGQTSPQGVDGLITSVQRLPTPNLPVTVTIGGLAVPQSDIAYAGEAPLNVAGVIQVNAKIPVGVGPGTVPVVISVGGVPSQANLTVSVR